MQTVKLSIKPNGKMKLEVIGVCGAECQALTEPIERALGKVVSSTPTDEYYLESQVDREVNQ